MRYLSRLLGAASARRPLPGDAAALALGLVVAASSAFAGHHGIGASLALGLGAALAALVLLRLLVAPHALWLEDRATIAELRGQLLDPERYAPGLFEQAFRAARADFVADLSGYLDKLPHSTIRRRFTSPTLAALKSKAAIFLDDRAVRQAWEMFAYHFEREVHVAYFDAERDLDGAAQMHLNRNLNYYFEMRRAIVLALIAALERRDDVDLAARITRINEKYGALGLIDLYDRPADEPLPDPA